MVLVIITIAMMQGNLFCEKDISNPFDEESCLNAIQYCLESKAMSQSRSNQSIQDSSIKNQM